MLASMISINTKIILVYIILKLHRNGWIHGSDTVRKTLLLTFFCNM